MSYFIAIDAGGTSTRCVLADERTILARASTGSIKLMRVGEPEATLRLTTLLNDVATAARVPLTQITRTCIGLAGNTIPAVRAWATAVLSATVSGSLLLVGDEEIALTAAFPNAPAPSQPAPSGAPTTPAPTVISAPPATTGNWHGGILLIAGTGTNCIGRAADGTLHRAGGYGPILGDQGGGFWIGLEAIRLALRSLDAAAPAPSEQEAELGAPSQTAPPSEVGSQKTPGAPSIAAPPSDVESPTKGPGAPSIAASSRWVGSTNPQAATDLLTQIQHHFHLTTLPELIDLGNRRTDPAPDFASLAPVIAHAAAAGNPIATATLHRAAASLAELILCVATKMGAPSQTAPPSEVGSHLPTAQPPLPIAFTGSILTQIPTIHSALATRLANILPQAHLHPTPVDPLLGALHLARHDHPNASNAPPSLPSS